MKTSPASSARHSLSCSSQLTGETGTVLGQYRAGKNGMPDVAEGCETAKAALDASDEEEIAF
jgi:hypothetical protein